MGKSLKDQLSALKKAPEPAKPVVVPKPATKAPPPKQPKNLGDPERMLDDADRYFLMAMDAPEEPAKPVANGSAVAPPPPTRAAADADALADLSEVVADPRKLDVRVTTKGLEALAPGADAKLVDLLRSGVFSVERTISAPAPLSRDLTLARRDGLRCVRVELDEETLAKALRTELCARLVLAAAGSTLLIRR